MEELGGLQVHGVAKSQTQLRDVSHSLSHEGIIGIWMEQKIGAGIPCSGDNTIKDLK